MHNVSQASTRSGHFRIDPSRPLGVGPEVMVGLAAEPTTPLAGWMRLKLRLRPVDERQTPFRGRLFAVTAFGPGRTLGFETPIEPTRERSAELIFEVPDDTTRLALVLPAEVADRLVGATYRVMPRRKALTRLLARGTLHAFGNPGALIRRGLSCWEDGRRYGFRGLLNSVRGQLIEGASHFVTPCPTYESWVASYDTLRPEDRLAWQDYLLRLASRATISVLLPIRQFNAKALTASADSLDAQLADGWELLVSFDPSIEAEVAGWLEARGAGDGRIKPVRSAAGADPVALLNAALDASRGDHVAVLAPGDRLAEDALAWVVTELDQHPDAALVYSDEDELDASGRRHSPRFKTDWNRELFHASNYVGALAAYRASDVQAAGGFLADPDGQHEYALILRMLAESPSASIRHVPRVLYHRSGSKDFSASPHALRSHLERAGITARVERAAGPTLRVTYPLPDPPPMVSVIIATRDREELLKTVVDGLLDGTDYPDLEVLIIDNDSSQPRALAYLKEIAGDPRVRVLRQPGPFNYSALNNHGAANARGEVLALLNNDLKMMDPGWLRELVSQALRPDVGVVGAMLYYPDDHIQHAGVLVGMGRCAGHAHLRVPRGQGGYLSQASHTQEYSAVTGACLACRAEVFREAGGLDEVNLAVAFNDIDFCLKVRERGYRVILARFAELYHLESASRGVDKTGEKALRLFREAEYMRSRWKHVLGVDPYLNPNLNLLSEQYILGAPPRVGRPFDA